MRPEVNKSGMAQHMSAHIWSNTKISGTAVAILALVSVAYFARSRRSPAPKAESLTYVDPKLCAGCHSNIWETYRRTGMARAFSRPQPDQTTKIGPAETRWSSFR